jgi:carbamoyl-phosphate synthase large subunit
MIAAAYRDRRVLVTGGAGVIGREMLDLLQGAGAEVMCCDLKPCPEWLDPAVTYIQGDANGLSAEQVGEFGAEYCFHLAATFERTTETEGFWEENFHHNVALGHHIATLVRDVQSIRRLVLASSYLVYDPGRYLFAEAQQAPTSLSEDAPVRPRNLCGSAKLMNESELDFLALFPSSGFTSVAARIFRVYGRGSNDVISRWVRSLLADQNTPLSTYRVEGLFDYIYAGDVAEGLLRLGSSDATGVVNLGSGTARRVSEVLEILATRFPALEWVQQPAEIDYEAHQASLERLQQIAGWQPTTSLEQGIERLIDHERAVTKKSRPGA